MCQGQLLPAIKLLCWAKIFFLRVRPPINASVSALGNCAAGFPHAEIICPRPLFAKRRVSDAFGAGELRVKLACACVYLALYARYAGYAVLVGYLTLC